MASNPMLNEQFFRPQTASARAGIDARADQAAWGPGPGPAAPPYVPASTERTMSMGGVVSATAVLLGVILVGAIIGWSQVTLRETTVFERTVVDVEAPFGLLIGSILVAFVLSLVARFKPPLARYLGIPYALAEGVALGMISHMYDVQSKGIAIQAVLVTLGVFAVMLVLYSARVLRATPKFVKGMVAAMGGIMLMYVFALVFSLFGHELSFLHDGSPLAIGISLVVSVVAALNLIIHFDFIEHGSQAGLPTYMEWFAALGLVIAIVWLYLEILRLLSNLNRR